MWTQVRREGGRTPQICFMVNTKAGETAEEIYHNLYQPGRYRELWFMWQDRPLLICDPQESSPAVARFFTLRKAHWPFEQVYTHNAWHWEAAYPQVFSYDTDPSRPEQVNVAVAQNLRVRDGKVTNMSEGKARGRSFHNGRKDTAPGAVNQGLNFAEQWQRALELDPPFVMVTGWNEWIAGKHSRPGLTVVFVDQFDQGYSRDIEPCGACTATITIISWSRMSGVTRVSRHCRKHHPRKRLICPAVLSSGVMCCRSFTINPATTTHRNFGRGERRYVNQSGRNDLQLMKVTRDETNVYFYAQTRQQLTPMSDPNWMWLLIDADQNPQTGWEGYDFILNRTGDGGESWLEENTGGWQWERISKVQITVLGNGLIFSILRQTLGLSDGNDLTFDFKWWDNAQKPGDIMDTYLSGDVAPLGRFNYRYAVSRASLAGASS